MSNAVGRQIQSMQASIVPIIRFVSQSTYARRGSAPGACDFCFGNPHEMPLREVSEALAGWAVPRDKGWFAYKFSEPVAVAAVAESIRARHGIDFEDADISMTNGAFGAIAASLRALVDAGDEVIYLSPPWFFYQPMIIANGATPVRVDLPAPDFRLPLDEIEAAITARTRAIIVNSPHNPSGVIYSPEELERLGKILDAATTRNGRPVYLLSDEAYSRILLDGGSFRTPLHHYHRSLLLYTYGKTLLTPGQRIGYIALPPSMPDREEVRQALFAAQLATGYAFPNAVMQYALGDLEKATIDIAALRRRRDRLTAALEGMGYQTNRPEATFYLLVRSPIEDDFAYAELLAEHDVFVMPGEVFELPGWFRISLTANDDMVERSLAGFEAGLRRVRKEAVTR